MKITYTPGQLGLALHKTIEKHKKDLGAGVPQKKLEWIKETAISLIDFLEQKVISFNRENPHNTLSGKEIASVLSTSLNLVIKVLKKKPKSK